MVLALALGLSDSSSYYLISLAFQDDRASARTASNITLIIRLQLGHTAISSPSRRSSSDISKRSPQGHGKWYICRVGSKTMSSISISS